MVCCLYHKKKDIVSVPYEPKAAGYLISKELIEYGFEKAIVLGYKAVLLEKNLKNYNPRGFVISADHGIIAGPDIHLPHVSCLMIKELVPGTMEHIHGIVDYSFYETLQEES